jgi:hypothetical protein
MRRGRRGKKDKVREGLMAVLGGLAMLAGLLVVLLGANAAAPTGGNPLSFGTATPVFTLTGGVAGLTLADLDRDGHLDLAFAPGNSVQIAAGTSPTFTGWLAPVVVGSATGGINTLLAADLDRDVRTDLVAFSGDVAGGQVRFPADTFTADWGTPVEIAVTGGLVRAVGVADLNRDGHLDLLSVAGDDLQMWENPGGPFSVPWTISVTLSSLGSELHSLFVADLDGDGRPDPVAGDAAGNLLVWSNPLTPGLPFTGDWPSPVTLGTIGEPLLSLTGGDFDHDGWVDLVAGGGGPVRTVRAWRNSGTLSGAWETLTLGTRGDGVYVLVAADADADGDLDLLSGSGAGDTAQVVWWPNTLIHRDAPFSETILPVGQSASGVEALVRGDLNRDGWPDLGRTMASLCKRRGLVMWSAMHMT